MCGCLVCVCVCAGASLHGVRLGSSMNQQNLLLLLLLAGLHSRRCIRFIRVHNHRLCVQPPSFTPLPSGRQGREWRWHGSAGWWCTRCCRCWRTPNRHSQLLLLLLHLLHLHLLHLLLLLAQLQLLLPVGGVRVSSRRGGVCHYGVHAGRGHVQAGASSRISQSSLRTHHGAAGSGLRELGTGRCQ